MPRGEHLKQYRWQPGQSGNPEGSKPQPINEKMLRRFTKEHVADVFNQIMELTEKELTAFMADDNVSAFEKAIAKTVEKARDSGDMTQIEKLLDRIIGKVPQKVDGIELPAAPSGPATLAPVIVELHPVMSHIAPPKGFVAKEPVIVPPDSKNGAGVEVSNGKH